MAASSRAQVLRLYRALLRESQRFGGYNYRTYAIRRIRDAFRENKNIKDSEKIEELVNKAKVNLEVIHRQARSPGCFLGVSEACTGHVGSSSTDHKHQTSTASQSCLLPLANCIPRRNWLLRVQETHSYEKSLILKQHWTIFSILQCHIQMRKLTAHV
ncbi:LYR motif-containing protein 4 isoform 1-T1 [Morphnus guianensis]